MNGLLSRKILPTLDRNIHIMGIELHAPAFATGFFSGNDQGAASEERIEDNVAGRRAIEDRIGDHGNGFNGWVQIEIFLPVWPEAVCTGIFPDKLKIAKVLPLFKKGNIHLFDNYRPISLLPSISKVFEKIVYKQVYDYFLTSADAGISDYCFCFNIN